VKVCNSLFTNNIVLTDLLDHSWYAGPHTNGKMKVVRLKSNAATDEFAKCLRTVRRLCGLERSFEVIADSSTNTQPLISLYFNAELQNCNLKFRKTVESKKRVFVYEDLEGLPCILLLCEKGRMGDTFPRSFNCLDTRGRNSDRTPDVTCFRQEIGRLCRYSETRLPYVILGKSLFNALQKCAVDQYHAPLPKIDS
jgi:hypothetical protein